MAKKKPITGSSSFSELNDFLNTIAPDGEIIDDNPMAKIDEWISTGSYILNAALSGSVFGGMPNRRSLGLAGEEGSGKTYVALSICRNAINNHGYQVIYMDSEGSIDKDFVARLGVDTSKVRLQAVNTIEEVNFIASQIIDQFEKNAEAGISSPKVMIVLDSLGNLTSEKEATDTKEGNDKRDMTKQQAIRKLFRVNGMKFAKHGIPLIVNAHVYECVAEDTKVTMSDNSIKNIKDINKGEHVLTLAGPKEVLDTFNFNVNNYIELEFENNYVIKCSSEHKFAMEKNGRMEWVTADHLIVDDEVLIE